MKSINMKELLKAMEQLEKEEGIDKEFLKDALITALEAAYKENYQTEENAKIELDNAGNIMIYDVKKVVEKVEDPNTEILLQDAKKIQRSAKIGGEVKKVIVPKNFGRIAIQKGKQIIVQKLREKEKEVRYNEYSAKIGEVLTGLVQKADKGPVILDLGKLEGVMIPQEQVESENYQVNQKLRVYVKGVVQRERGDIQVQVSRKDANFVKRLFEYEIPEIDEGLIIIKAVSREAGQRSKVAVYSSNENIDPVGSCVGQKGLRIENIRKELNNEHIDVVEWSEDTSKFIAQALLPAQIMAVDLNEETKFAQVIVADDQLSLAIGKKGQNVRLAVELTGWKIDIKTITEFKRLLEEGIQETEEVLEESEVETYEEVEENETSKDIDVEIEVSEEVKTEDLV
ncbi:MAG: transcription termination factor NusA [Clostridium sp.]